MSDTIRFTRNHGDLSTNRGFQFELLKESSRREGVKASCPKCEAPLERKAKFCPECGADLVQKPHCTECGAEVPPRAKFCAGCGAKVSAHA